MYVSLNPRLGRLFHEISKVLHKRMPLKDIVFISGKILYLKPLPDLYLITFFHTAFMSLQYI